MNLLKKKTFGKRAVFSQIRSRRYFKSYALYAICVPLTVVIAAHITEHLDLISIDYGIHGQCWIGNTNGSAVFFAAPICFVVVTNGIMYVLTISSIRYVAKKMKSNGVPTQKNRGRKDFFIYLRMFSLLSFNWIFGILTWSIPEDSPEHLLKLQDIFVGIFVVLTGANGIFICFIFTLNPRVFGLYYKVCLNNSCFEK